jgi:hypothetical protein
MGLPACQEIRRNEIAAAEEQKTGSRDVLCIGAFARTRSPLQRGTLDTEVAETVTDHEPLFARFA